MKILFLITNLSHSAGTERVTALIANSLVNKNFNVDIASINLCDKPGFSLDNRIGIVSLFDKEVSLKKVFFTLLFKLRFLLRKNQYDFLVTVNSGLALVTVPSLIGMKIKHVCWEHFNFETDLNKGAMTRYYARKLAAKYCDIIVTLTNCDKHLWIKNLGEKIESKIKVIPNPTPFENKVNVPRLSNKKILAIGRLTHQKGFDLLINAWSKIQDSCLGWTLVIVGDGEDRGKIEDLIKSNNLSKTVILKPFQNDVENLYETCSFYCLSSRYEGFGMVLIEAQSFGIPLISFDCTAGPNEIITDGWNGYLAKKDDIYDLKDKLLLAIRMNDSDYESMIDNSYVNSKNYYPNVIVQNWFEIFS